MSGSEIINSSHLKKIHNIGEETSSMYKDIDLKREDICIESISIFKPHIIKSGTTFCLQNGERSSNTIKSKTDEE